MKSFTAYIKVGNLFLLALAGGAAFLVFMAFGIVFPSVYTPESPDAEEVYPFSLTSEFPVSNLEDEAALKAAVTTFLTLREVQRYTDGGAPCP